MCKSIKQQPPNPVAHRGTNAPFEIGVWFLNDRTLLPYWPVSEMHATMKMAMNINAKRSEQIDFTQPLYRTPAQLVARTGSPLQPMAASLASHKVGVLQGSIQEQYAKEAWAAKGVDVVSYQTQDLVYADLAAGRLDATFVDATAASLGFLNQPAGKGFAFAGLPVKDAKVIGTGVGIGVRKDDKELVDALNSAFLELKRNGTYQKLLKKYFTVDLAVD